MHDLANITLSGTPLPGGDETELTLALAERLLACKDTLSYMDVAVQAARVYDRKGYPSCDSLTSPRNPSYASSDDALIIQVTMKVDYHELQRLDATYLDTMEDKRIAHGEEEKQRLIAKRQTEIERLQDEIADLNAS
jgi:hypothetical protein